MGSDIAEANVLARDVRVTGVCLAVKPKARDNGEVLLAHLDIEAAGFQFLGCLLIERKNGTGVVHLPQPFMTKSERWPVQFATKERRDSFGVAARVAYDRFLEAMGGYATRE